MIAVRGMYAIGFLVIFLHSIGYIVSCVTLNPHFPAITPIDPSEMVVIPEGEFIMGSDQSDGEMGLDFGVDEVPRHKRFLKRFFIDTYEVTNDRYSDFIKETGHRHPLKTKIDDVSTYLYNWEDDTYPSDKKNYPVVLVDWYDAAAYCRWAKKRLPTEAEWEKAARGSEGNPWPWGKIFNKMYANVKNLGLNLMTRVGSFPQGASPYGAMDMVGNVFEWTHDWYDRYKGNTLKRKEFGKKYKVIKGGAFSYWGEPHSRPATRFIAQLPTFKHRSYGFRCVKESI